MENRHKDNNNMNNNNHFIPSDILDDLASRFIINVPMKERSDIIRICFQIELAHWFYLDFYCSTDDDEKLQPCGIKQFANHIFQHIPFLNAHISRLNDIMTEFKFYKMSVPTYGAILIADDYNNVLLVQSYWAKSSWGFPKGKVNEDEEPLHCAIREVHEETGYDISKLIKASDYIDGVINYQYTRLYIVKNVPISTVFVPRTRKEIKCCEWFQLDHLPSHKSDQVSKANLGINPNSFFMIMPFVKRLKRWLSEQNTAKDAQKLSDSHSKTHKFFSSEHNVTKRERLKSTGDLDDYNRFYGNGFSAQSPHYIKKRDKRDLTIDNGKNQYSLTKIDIPPKSCQINGSTSTKKKPTPEIKSKKSTNKIDSLSNLMESINLDENISKWNDFSFSIDNIINVYDNSSNP